MTEDQESKYEDDDGDDPVFEMNDANNSFDLDTHFSSNDSMSNDIEENK